MTLATAGCYGKRMRSCRLAVLVVLAASSCEDEGEECPEADRAGELVAGVDPARHEDGGDACAPVAELGPPTEAVCPPSSTLTYENFGQPFMEHYCTRCHSSTLTGDARQDAPLYHDFDSLDGILAVADHVDQKAASGPAAANVSMPIATPAPSMEERVQLGEWLACELAAM